MAKREVMISTLDNPFNPITQYNDWDRYDKDYGYNTMNYLARIVTTTDELTEEIYDQYIENAIDEILELNITGNYIKVVEIV